MFVTCGFLVLLFFCAGGEGSSFFFFGGGGWQLFECAIEGLLFGFCQGAKVVDLLELAEKKFLLNLLPQWLNFKLFLVGFHTRND